MTTYNLPNGTSINIPDVAQPSVEESGVSIEYFSQRVDKTVFDFGAIGDGVNDDTSAFQNALNSCDVLHIPKPSVKYIVGNLTIPNTCKKIYGDGYGTYIYPLPTLPNTTSNIFSAINVEGLEITGLHINVDKTLFSNITSIYVLNGKNVKADNNYFTSSGFTSIYFGNCLFSSMKNNFVGEYYNKALRAEGALCDAIEISSNTITGTGITHAISCQAGEGYNVKNNNVYSSGYFGIGFYDVINSKITGNLTANSVREGINIEASSNNEISDNTCFWNNASGTDFGISVYGNPDLGTFAQYNTVVNNTVIRASKSGIALADSCQYNIVSDNSVTSSNRENALNHAGIVLYGIECTKNKISNNRVTDTIDTKSYFGINGNVDFGTGIASNNVYNDNDIFGFTVNELNKDLLSVETGQRKNLYGDTWQPTITSGSGTITSSNSTGYYMEMGKAILINLTINITNNGTGAEYVNATLPYNVTGNFGVLVGKENALNGKSLICNVTNGNIQIRTYDNLYPAGTGSNIVITGYFFRP